MRSRTLTGVNILKYHITESKMPVRARTGTGVSLRFSLVLEHAPGIEPDSSWNSPGVFPDMFEKNVPGKNVPEHV